MRPSFTLKNEPGFPLSIQATVDIGRAASKDPVVIRGDLGLLSA